MCRVMNGVPLLNRRPISGHTVQPLDQPRSHLVCRCAFRVVQLIVRYPAHHFPYDTIAHKMPKPKSTRNLITGG